MKTWNGDRGFISERKQISNKFEGQNGYISKGESSRKYANF